MNSPSLPQVRSRHFGAFTLLAVAALGCLQASAALVANAVPGVTGFAFQQGDSGDPNGDGGVNNILNGDGLTVGNLAVSSTWTHDSNWQTGWQGNAGFTPDSAGAGSAATPGAWFIADLGVAVTGLDKLYIWNVREVLDRGTKNVDLFYSSTPVVLPATGSAYNFTSGGWASLLSSHTVPQATGTGTPADDIVDLSAIGSARYIGFRINSNYNSDFRVGFAELQFTTVPEPSVALLMGVCALGLVKRRRA